MDSQRRILLKGTLATGAVVAAAGAGLLQPRAAFAALPKSAFEATKQDEALTAAFGNAPRAESAAVKIKAPAIAENSAVVPVTVESDLKNVESISVLVEGNPRPMTASFDLTSHSEPFAAVRIKMAKTSNVTAVVKADGKVFTASQEVKVTIGGCGG